MQEVQKERSRSDRALVAAADTTQHDAGGGNSASQDAGPAGQAEAACGKDDSLADVVELLECVHQALPSDTVAGMPTATSGAQVARVLF
jgi:hypothetical protein